MDGSVLKEPFNIMKSNQNVNALAIHHNDHTNFSSHPFNRLTLYICNFSCLFGLQFKIACYQLLDDWVEFWSINYSDMYQYQLKKGVRELVYNTCGKRGKKMWKHWHAISFPSGFAASWISWPEGRGNAFCYRMMFWNALKT